MATTADGIAAAAEALKRYELNLTEYGVHMSARQSVSQPVSKLVSYYSRDITATTCWRSLLK